MREFRAMSFELRLVGLILLSMLVPTLTVGWFGYEFIFDHIRNENIRNVGRVAESQRELLRTVLGKTEARIKTLAIGMNDRCVGDSEQNFTACAHEILRTFAQSERAIGVVYQRIGTAIEITVGAAPVRAHDLPPFRPRQIAHVSPHQPGAPRTYTIVASDPNGRNRLTVTYPVAVLQDIFGRPLELGRSGETFLSDAEGFFITTPRYPSPQGYSHPISARPMQKCLSPADTEVLDLDYRDIAIIHGFRHIPEIGGGCIMAHIDQEEAFGALRTLQSRVLMLTLGFLVLATAASLYLGRGMVRPIRDLIEATRAIAAGNYGARARVAGGKEIAELAGAFNRMTEHLRLTLDELRAEVSQNAEGRAKAEVASRAKSDFIANISHELRTPLNAIIGFSEVLKLQVYGPIGNPHYLEYIDHILQSGNHLLAIVNDILDVAAIEFGKVVPNDNVVAIAAVADATVRLVQARAEAGKVALHVDVPSNLPALRCDERRVKQIFLNLLTNAIRFTPEGGEVALSARRAEDGGLLVQVRDTGIGMDTDDQIKALAKFGQVDSGLDRKHDGAGLGLPLTVGLVELHGGRFRLDSARGQGTTVSVAFPAERVITA